MSGTWLKIAILAVLVIGVIIGMSMLSSDEPSAPGGPQGPQTYGEQVAEDRQKFAIDYENQSLPQTQQAAPAQPQAPAQQAPAVQPQPAAPPREFRELEDIEDQVAAERLYQMALNERSMGRLPGVGKYRRMVEYCRQILRQYPGTVYAYQAKQMMADIPREYQEQCGITADELDLSK